MSEGEVQSQKAVRVLPVANVYSINPDRRAVLGVLLD